MTGSNGWNPCGGPGNGGGGPTGKLYLIAVSESSVDDGLEGGRRAANHCEIILGSI
jgi:hypothetical protein